MKQLSFWAKDHKWASRILIITSFILLNILGLATGILLNDLYISVSKTILILAVSVFAICWWIYPSRKSRTKNIHKEISYTIRKYCDLLLVSSTFLMIIFFANKETAPLNYATLNVSAVNSFSLPADSNKTYKSLDEFKKLMKDADGKPLKWKERKKLLKQQIKGIKNANDISSSGKVLLIILSVLMAVLLAYGVAALSCSLSCSGSEGAAVVVAILGMAGIVVLTFFIIRSIVRKSKKEKPKTEEPESGTIKN